MKQLAQSSFWKIVVDTYIRPKIYELTNTNSINKELSAEEYKIKALAGQLACEEIENIIEGIDCFNGDVRTNRENNYE